MRVILILISFVVYLNAQAQKPEFGINVQGGISTISTKNSSLQMFNSNQGIPKESDLIHPSLIWSTKQIDLKVYLSRPKNLSFSLGLRAFRFKWDVDTVGISVYEGSVNPPTGSFKAYYASQKNTLEYYLPTIGVNYDINLFGDFWLNSSFNIGKTSFLYFKKRNSIAYDGGQDAFDYLDRSYLDGEFLSYFERNIIDFQLQTALAYNYKYLSIYTGAAFYYFKDYSMRYFGLHLNAGLALRFKRGEK